MLKLYETHKDEISANTALKPEKIRQIKYLHEFDREVQCATWGYPTEGAYYRDASSGDSVMAIRTPTLCLHAEDDPIVANEAVPYEEIKTNPYVVMCSTRGGGHLCWFEWGGGRWHTKPVSLAPVESVKVELLLMMPQTTNFLNVMARDVDCSKIKAPKGSDVGPHGGHETPFVFEPMRRKLHLPGSDQ